MTDIPVVKDVLARNDTLADENRRRFDEHGVFVVNFMSSPGAGKTTFVIETIRRLRSDYRIGVIEGDVASQVDAERIRETGVPVVQVNTGGACHLDAAMVRRTLDHLSLDDLDVIIIENVGNLVCPAEWRLGEDMKVTLLSVPEGDDKPIKYPLMFTEADVLAVSKIDLLALSDFDMEVVEKTIHGLNPGVEILPVSCRTGEGLDRWERFLRRSIEEAGA